MSSRTISKTRLPGNEELETSPLSLIWDNFEPVADFPEGTPSIRRKCMQRLPPVEPASEPNQDHAEGMGRSSRFDLALLIQRELFVQKEILGGEGGAWA